MAKYKLVTWSLSLPEGMKQNLTFREIPRFINVYYLLKIIQKFWLVKSGGWNRHICSVVAQIWSYDIIIEYWKHMRHYDVICSYIENTYTTLWRHTNYAAYAKWKIHMAYAAYAKIQNTNNFFKEKVRKYK